MAAPRAAAPGLALPASQQTGRTRLTARASGSLNFSSLSRAVNRALSDNRGYQDPPLLSPLPPPTGFTEPAFCTRRSRAKPARQLRAARLPTPAHSSQPPFVGPPHEEKPPHRRARPAGRLAPVPRARPRPREGTEREAASPRPSWPWGFCITSRYVNAQRGAAAGEGPRPIRAPYRMSAANGRRAVRRGGQADAAGRWFRAHEAARQQPRLQVPLALRERDERRRREG
jgi:hypothetical protein